MTSPLAHDPEAAWPLTEPETGYIPAPDPGPSKIVPLPPPPSRRRRDRTPGISADQMPWGIRIAILAIVLGVAVPLTAITFPNLIALAIVWIGIVMVTAFTLGGGR